MLNSGIVDVAIGLAFIYLLLSLICSALAEWVSRLFALRSSNLEQGIRTLVHDTPDSSGSTALGSGTAGAIYGHPLIQSFFRQGWFDRLTKRPGRPSYIPTRAFATVVVDLLIPEDKRSSPPEIEDIRNSIEALDDGQLKRTLLTLLNQGEQSVTAFRTALEQWFDDGMERVSGWYKRNLQLILLGIGLLLSLSLNADSFAIGQTLWKDEALRDSVAAAAEKYVGDQAEDDTDGEQLEANIAVLQEQLDELQIPIGWTNADGLPGSPIDDPAGWLAKIGGLLITAIALSLGAPFWFDLLNKLVNLRSTGSPPEDGIRTQPQYGAGIESRPDNAKSPATEG